MRTSDSTFLLRIKNLTLTGLLGLVLISVGGCKTETQPDNPVTPISNVDEGDLLSTLKCLGQPYEDSISARGCFRWPFKGGKFEVDTFWDWFWEREEDGWMGRSIYFDGLDPKKLGLVQLETEKVRVRALVFNPDAIKDKNFKLSMNGFKGVALDKTAVEYKIVAKYPLDHSFKRRFKKVFPKFKVFSEGSYSNGAASARTNFSEKNHGQDNRDGARGRDHDKNRDNNFDSDNKTKSFNVLHEDEDDFCPVEDAEFVYVAEVTFRLEKFVFGVKRTAAELIRESLKSKKPVHFRVRHVNDLFRMFDGKLELKGHIPGDCPTPTPTPSPTATPTPTPTATPTPTPPPTPTPWPAPIVSITSTSVGALTNSQNFQATFVADQPASFVCSTDNAPYLPCVSPFITNGLADGLHHFSVKGTNADQVTSLPAQYDWTVDATTPIVQFDSIVPPDLVTAVSNLTLNFSANEVSSFDCQVDQDPWKVCASPLTLNALADGIHTVMVQAKDLAGNQGLPVQHSWTVKTQPPSVVITGTLPAENPSNSLQRSFYFSGSADAVRFVCSFDNGTQTVCTSPFTANSLTEGLHQFSVWGVDSVGNLSASANYSFSTDITAPTTAIMAVDPIRNPTNNTAMQLSFSANEGAIFSCSVDAGPMTRCTSPVSYASFLEGTHTVSVVATDPAGNVSSPATYSWTVDLTAPVLSLVSVNPSGALINQRDVSVNFSVNEVSQITCSLDGGTPQACSTPMWGLTGLVDGAHSILISAVDSAGNVGAPLAYSFTVDTLKPIVRIDSVAPVEAVTQIDSVTFNFSASESLAIFQCQSEGGGFSGCSSPLSYSNLSNGAHTFSVRGVDAAGNESVSAASYSWTIDKQAPVITLIQQNPSGSVIAVPNVTFTITADEAVTLGCIFDGVGPIPCASPVSYNGLADGNHSFAVRATDMAGNSTLSSTVFFAVNTQPLAVANVLVAGISRSGATITWTTNQPGSSRVYYALSGSTTYQQVSNSGLNTNHSITLTGLNPFALYTFFVESTAPTGQTARSPNSLFRTLR